MYLLYFFIFPKSSDFFKKITKKQLQFRIHFYIPNCSRLRFIKAVYYSFKR
nr:MAG TPA: hypothetical protein [Caudoviricetes sp.]